MVPIQNFAPQFTYNFTVHVSGANVISIIYSKRRVYHLLRIYTDAGCLGGIVTMCQDGACTLKAGAGRGDFKGAEQPV